MFTIAIDRAHSLVQVTLGGMLTVAEAGDYVEQLRRTFVTQHVPPGYRMIIDISACPIQSQDMVKAMGTHIASMPKASAIAIVTGSSLAQMQVRRLFTQPYARAVSTLAEARAWVLTRTEPCGETIVRRAAY